MAVHDVSFTVHPGTVHALLGTNGAGKTTLLETLQGFRPLHQGQIRVFGQDPARARTRIAARTGTMLQESGLVDELTVAGQLDLWRSLSLRPDTSERVLKLVGLTDHRRTPVADLSGGERRRLDFAMAIWGDPQLLILDEPTTGLDPQSRRMLWRTMQDLVARGSAVLLTTHYLEEAQQLADTVTILDQGVVAREGRMETVLDSIPATISFTAPSQPHHLQHLADQLAGSLELTPRPDATAVEVRTPTLQADVGRVIDWARTHRVGLDGLRCAPASLEDVFLAIADRHDDSPTAHHTDQIGA